MEHKKRKAKAEIPPDPDAFLKSVTNMTENDIDLNETAKKVKKKPVDFLRSFVLMICVGVFVYAGYNIVEKVISYIQAAKDNDALLSFMYGTNSDSQDTQSLKKSNDNSPIQDILYLQNHGGNNGSNAEETNVGAKVVEGVSEVDQFMVNFKNLSDIYPDVYGWVKVSGTNVDYPVVQSTDNEYYLKHNYYKKSQGSGAIFTDFRNDRDVSKNQNTVIYGHNMADSSMFSTLMNYWKNENVFKSGIIELRTLNGTYRYEVFAVHEEVPTYPYIEVNFGPDCRYASVADFINDMKSRSKYQKDIKFDENSKVITLSTCTNAEWRGNPRMVVQGILIDVVN